MRSALKILVLVASMTSKIFSTTRRKEMASFEEWVRDIEQQGYRMILIGYTLEGKALYRMV